MAAAKNAHGDGDGGGRRMARWRRRARRLAVVLVSAATGWLLLAIPAPAPRVPERPAGAHFVWDQDALWEGLEALFLASREAGCPTDYEGQRQRLDEVLGGLGSALPSDPRWDDIEAHFFELAAHAGACPGGIAALLAVRRHLREVAKEASRGWFAPEQTPVPIAGRASAGRVSAGGEGAGGAVAGRDRLYRLLYGSRAAVEEVLLQLPPELAPALSHGRDEPSATPAAELGGVRLHSGDLLLSRGGAPTSAFIARGNDYPGNFSHVALVHVDGSTGAVSVIEAHIERGVTVASGEAYLADKKLRILLLRPRADHPALVADPGLPHRVATESLAEARRIHIPYDFAMDIDDAGERFCSEVASAAYGGGGITLWRQLSTFSSPGLARWMAALGVRHLETQSPSDLEYDPQLTVVAEWHDPETLLADHIDNAILDALIEQAEAGAELDYRWHLLPFARVLKAWSAGLNLLGREGPVPEGMSAAAALRVRSLGEWHGAIRARVEAGVEAFRARRGYTPPYWDLVHLARAAVDIRASDL